jgi:hypothetical protein
LADVSIVGALPWHKHFPSGQQVPSPPITALSPIAASLAPPSAGLMTPVSGRALGVALSTICAGGAPVSRGVTIGGVPASMAALGPESTTGGTDESVELIGAIGISVSGSSLAQAQTKRATAAKRPAMGRGIGKNIAHPFARQWTLARRGRGELERLAARSAAVPRQLSDKQ